MDIQSVPLETMAILHAFSRALGREVHVLTGHPELLWQQLYNRLQWEGEGDQAGTGAGTGKAQSTRGKAMGANLHPLF